MTSVLKRSKTLSENSYIQMYEGVTKCFRTESITKYKVTFDITC
jgi:hypothetical protein